MATIDYPLPHPKAEPGEFSFSESV
jgi:hypothetical protein